MRPTTAMIFCAGFGTRMGTLTQSVPKPLLGVGGQTLFDRTHKLAKDAGVSRVCINTHYLAEKMEAHVIGMGVHVSREDPDILDTGGGLKRAGDWLGTEPVFTANPDVIWAGPNPFSVLADAWGDHWDAILLCVPASRAIGRHTGDFAVRKDSKIERTGDLVFGGIQIIRPAAVNETEGAQFSLNAVWDRLITSNRAGYAVYPGHWCDVGTPDGLERAGKMIDLHGVV